MNSLEIRLCGEIDHRAAERLTKEMKKEIAREKPQRLILDFREVEMMDSSGIGMILGRYKEMKELGGEILIKNTTKQVDKVMELSGLYQIIKKL